MRICCHLFIALLAVSAAAGSAPEGAYNRMYVFGDSYSDSGAGYIDGNGPTAVVYLAQRLHLPFTFAGDPAATKDSGLNFAVSGAQTGEAAGRRFKNNELLGKGMKNQVADFTAMVHSGKVQFDAEKTVFYLLGGLNDGRLADGVTKENIEGEIEGLYALGGRHFRVALLPVKIPPFTEVGTRLNPQLTMIPDEERARHPDLDIRNSRWGAFYDEVLEHPAKYGLTNTVDQCAGRSLFNQDTTPCASPNTYYYYHDGHPSTATHKAVGDMLFVEATSEAPSNKKQK
jgi:phospholipase/lecithinase/hemolysin